MRKVVTQAAGRLHEQIRMVNAGMTPGEIKSANAEAQHLFRDYKPVGQTDILHMLRNTRSVVGAYTEAAEMIRPLLDLRVITQHASPHASAAEINENFDKLVKSAELAGVTSNMSKFENYIEGISKAINVFGDTIKPYQFFEAIQYARQAATGLSPDFVAGVLPTLIQHHGGAQAGTALSSFNQAIVSGKLSNVAVNELLRLGLLNTEKDANGHYKYLVETKTGNVKGVKPGGIVGAALARSDPDKWISEYLVKALVKAGVTDQAMVSQVIQRLLPGRVAGQFATEMITMKSVFDKDRSLIHGAKGRSAAQEIMARDFDQSIVGLKNSFDALAAALGKPLMGPGVKATNTASSLFTTLAGIASGDPTTAYAGLGAGLWTGAVGASMISRLGLGAGLGLPGVSLGATPLALGYGLAGIGALWAGSKLGQGAANIIGTMYGPNWATSSADDIAALKKERAELEAEIAAIRARMFDKSAFNPEIDRKSRLALDIGNRIAASERRYAQGAFKPVAPGLVAFGAQMVSPYESTKGVDGWNNAPATWSKRPKGAKRWGRPVSFDQAMGFPSLGGGDPALTPQKADVSVHATADPIKIEVSVTAATPLLQAYDRMREATATLRLNTGIGSVGSTDFGNQH